MRPAFCCSRLRPRFDPAVFTTNSWLRPRRHAGRVSIRTPVVIGGVAGHGCRAAGVKKLAEVLNEAGCDVILIDAERGMGATSLQRCARRMEGWLVTLGDMPWIDRDGRSGWGPVAGRSIDCAVLSRTEDILEPCI